MKRTLLILLAASMLSTPAAFAADGEVTLDSSEHCNNWIRRYCSDGHHAKVVDAQLVKIKKLGTKISVELIRMVALRTNLRAKPGAEEPAE
ncbi:MAG: hypothetical protein QNL04_05475 [SAR324 cluster bacterium]|nr:hypothetical protein [SAR324 cluster bacterium]